MELPNPIEVRNDLSKTIEDLDIVINFISTKPDVTFFEFHRNIHPITMELIEIHYKINLLTTTDRKYLKPFEKLGKILIRQSVDLREVEKKHVGHRRTSWESIFQEGKLRKDLINHLKDISKQLKNIQKNL